MIGYQEGRLEAFEQVYTRLAGPLRRFLLSQTRDVTRAEDLLQETFLQIHRSRRTYLPSLPVQPWAMAIARHVFLMEVRAASRRLRHVVSDPGDLAVRAQGDPQHERLVQRDEIEQALRQLPPDRREAVMLHHVSGLSFKDIGKRAGIREAAAKLRSSRGMARLRTILGRASKKKDGSPDDR